MGAARWKSWRLARAPNRQQYRCFSSLLSIFHGRKYGFPIRNFSIRSQMIRTRRTYRADTATAFIARRGAAFKNILSYPVNTCARRPSRPFSHVDPICIAVTYMQICVYALFNPHLRLKIACFYASFKARAVRVFTKVQGFRGLQYFLSQKEINSKEIQFKLIDRDSISRSEIH